MGKRYSSPATHDHPCCDSSLRNYAPSLSKRGRQRETLPALMQEVQTFSRFGVPDTTACTRWMFGFQRRLVFFFDQGTLWPNPGLLPHMSHTAATGIRSQEITSHR